MTLDRWFDLLLNVITEALGIVVTVFFIDRLIKRREEARWKSSKDFVYARLTEIVAEPFDIFSFQHGGEKPKLFIFDFGRFDTKIIKDISNLDSIHFSDPVSGNALRKIFYENSETATTVRLDEMKRSLDHIINDSANFLEPEILSLIFPLRKDVERLIFNINSGKLADLALPQPKGWYEPSHRLTVNLYHVISQSITIQNWLIRHSTRKAQIEGDAYQTRQ